MTLRYALLIAPILFAGGKSLHAQMTDRVRSTHLEPGSGAVALTPNRGQVVDTRGDRRPDVLYAADAAGTKVFVGPNVISYVFGRYVRSSDRSEASHEAHDASGETSLTLAEQYRMDLELVGARERADVLEEDPAEGVRNYYLAHCPDGILGVPSFHTVTFRDVYPKIDMVLHGTADGMKVDFVVRPGGSVADIRLRYVDASAVRFGDDGSIEATTPLGELVEAAPISLQTVDGTRRPIATRFRLDENVVTFDVEGFNAGETLVIDPIRRWSTYYGGTNSELLLGGDPTEVDRAGNAIITGYVNGTAFPATTGAHQVISGGSDDGFVVKLDGKGVLQWATYYGGSNQELPHGVVTDTSLNVFIAGHSLSNNFPTTAGAFQTTYSGNRDAFVVKFDALGTRQWATYYGGTAFDDGYGFAADSTGSVALLVTTSSANLQTSGMVARPANMQLTEPFDIIIAKFSPTGARLWATYFGGNNTDYGYAVGTDTSQSIIVSGWTYSANLPLTNPAQSTVGGGADVFVAKFDKDGARLWSTYYGGPNAESDQPTGLGFVGVATDRSGNVFVGGVVASGGFPTTTGSTQPTYGGGASDGYLIKFNALGARQWATYFGGSGDDVCTGVAARPDGAVLLTGYTTSTNLAVTTDCIYCVPQGRRDAFIARMSAVGVFEFVDYYGGTHNDEGHGISFGPYGTMVVAGSTYSTDFPIENAAQALKGGSSTTNGDAFIALFCDPPKLEINASGPLSLCPGDSVTLAAPADLGSYRWNNAEQSTTNRITVGESGSYVVSVVSAGGCAATSDTIEVRVHQRLQVSPVGPIDFGRVAVGTSSTPQTLTLYNRAEVPLRGRLVTRGPYSIVAPTGPVTIPPAPGSIDVTIVFTPVDSTDAPGAVAVYCEDPCVDSTIIPIGGRGSIVAVGFAAIVVPDSLRGAPGDVVSIPIILERGTLIRESQATTFRATLRFNRNLLLPVRVRAGDEVLTKSVAGATRGSIITQSIEGDDRVVTIEATNDPMPTVADTIAWIDATVMLADRLTTPIAIDSLFFTDGPVVTVTGSGVFTLIGYCEVGNNRLVRITGAAGIKAVRPNPLNLFTEIVFETSETGPTTLLISDAGGLVVERLIDRQRLTVGAHARTWSAGHLPSGVYYLELQTPTERSIARALLVK
jgi:hypothetical protein